MTETIGLSKPEMSVPGQVWKCDSAASEAFRPLQPPTLCRPMSVNGSSAAMMTKNCSTSL